MLAQETQTFSSNEKTLKRQIANPKLILWSSSDDKFQRRILDLSEPVKLARQTTLPPAENNVIFSSRVLSRNHALFQMIKNVPHVSDTGSSNGTFLNGVRLSAENLASEPVPLRDGDDLVFGCDIFKEDDILQFPKVQLKVQLETPQTEVLEMVNLEIQKTTLVSSELTQLKQELHSMESVLKTNILPSALQQQKAVEESRLQAQLWQEKYNSLVPLLGSQKAIEQKLMEATSENSELKERIQQLTDTLKVVEESIQVNKSVEKSELQFTSVPNDHGDRSMVEPTDLSSENLNFLNQAPMQLGSATSNQIEVLTSENDKLKIQIKALQEEVQSSMLALQSLESSQQAVKSLETRLDESKRESSKELEILKKEMVNLSSLKMNLEESFNQEKENLQTEINELKSVQANLLAENQALTGSLKDLVESTTRQEESRKPQESLEELVNTLTEAQIDFKERILQLESLKEQLINENKLLKRAQLEAQEAFNTEKECLETEISQLKSLNTDLIYRCTQLTSDNDVLNEKIKMAARENQVRLDELNSKLTQLEGDNALISQTVIQVESEASAASENLKSQIADSTVQLTQLEAKLMAETDKVHMLMKEIEQLINDKLEIENTKSSLQKAHDVLMSENQKMLNELTQDRLELDLLATNKLDLESLIKNQNSNITTMQSSIDALLSEKLTLLNTVQQLTEEIQASISRYQTDISQLKDLIKAKETQINLLESSHQQEIELINSEMTLLKANHLSLQTGYHSVDLDLSKTKIQLQEILEKNSSVETLLESKQVQINLLQESLARNKAQIDDFDSKYNQSVKENLDLKLKNSKLIVSPRIFVFGAVFGAVFGIFVSFLFKGE